MTGHQTCSGINVKNSNFLMKYCQKVTSNAYLPGDGSFVKLWSQKSTWIHIFAPKFKDERNNFG